MFSSGHVVWIFVSFILIGIALLIAVKRKAPLDKVIKVCFVLGIVSEIIKIYSVIDIVPMVNQVIVNNSGTYELSYAPTGQYTPMMGMEHLPLELCSLQIFFMGAMILAKQDRIKHLLFSLMYPTSIIGGSLGVIMASMTAYVKSQSEYLTSPRVWQYFLYHAMIIFMGIYIGICKESGLRFSDWRRAVFAVLILDIPSFYLNSVFSSKLYHDDELVGVTHRTNFLSSYVNPLGLVLTEKWQWLVYLLIRLILALILIILLFTPLLRRKYKERSS